MIKNEGDICTSKVSISKHKPRDKGMIMNEQSTRQLRVREKLLHFGAESLSDVELLTAFISIHLVASF